MKRISIFLMIMFLLIFCGCEGKNDLEANIIYPNPPYQENDNIMLKDQYAFYNLAGTSPQYWFSGNVHDPAIIKDGDHYYVFSTDAQYGMTTQKGLHIRKSDDLLHWSFVGTALDLQSVQEAVDYVEYNRDGQKVDFFWAPDIIKRPKAEGGYEYWLFYCNSSFGQRTSYLGMAKADNIEGPYYHSHEILRTHQSVGGTPNAIDPAIYVEEIDGEEKMYLSYGSWSAGIYIIELDPETGRPLIEQTLVEQEVSVYTQNPGETVVKKKLIPASKDDPAFGTKILNIYSSEAPYIIKEGDYYYLFVTSGNNLTYDYDVRVFRSRRIDGDYVDADGKSALSPTTPTSFRGYGNKITAAHKFERDSKEDGLDRGWAGIGHCSVLKDGDDWYFASHYRGTFMDKDRFFLGIRKMYFIDGWPIVCANRYSPGADEDLTKADISGRYKIYILQKEVANSSLDNNIISIITKASTIS
ncbi:MAG: arabinan endo-1,5-alpha-L-arabinosidase, partial [Acholeplasmataceae bacterium]|nr:arabinan endo-1,5-alpha-L-arabinosidase [Acholeplasmataceae bacterium]